MNAGLSNLTKLKGQLLAQSLLQVGNTSYDAIITAIGLGMASRIDRFCNRVLMRTVNKVDILRSDRRHWYLNCYPVEALIALAKKDSEADGWVPFPLPPDGNSLVLMMDLTTGYLNFVSIQGYFFSQLSITYTGGHWWNTLEPTDGGYPQIQPAGSFLLPNDIQLAWCLACQNVWKKWDKLGVQITQNPEPQNAIAQLELPDSVQDLLKPHIRYQIS